MAFGVGVVRYRPVTSLGDTQTARLAWLFKRLLGVDVMQLEGDWELALDAAQDRIHDLIAGVDTPLEARLGALVREYEIESDRIGLDGETMLDDVGTLAVILRRTTSAAISMREERERTEGGLGVSRG